MSFGKNPTLISYIKSNFSIVKNDFVEDMKNNYNYIKDIYKNISVGDNELYSKIENISLKDTKSRDYYDNLLNFMIRERIREQQLYISKPVYNRLSSEDYNYNFKIGKMKNSIFKKEEMVCSICQDIIFEDDVYCITKCKHMYHDKCAKEWYIKYCLYSVCLVCDTLVI